MTAHAEKWFVERIGKNIKRTKPKRGGEIEIEDELHAKTLYLYQYECGFRYDDL